MRKGAGRLEDVVGVITCVEKGINIGSGVAVVLIFCQYLTAVLFL